MSRMMKLAALSVGVAILVGVSPAVEADEGAGPDDLAVLVEAVEPDHGTEMILVEAQSLGSEAFVAEGDVAQVEVPVDPLSAVSVSDQDAGISISLPKNAAFSEGVPTDDGTVVFESADGRTEGVVVEALDDGSVQLQTVLGGPEADHDLEYHLGVPAEARVELSENGTVLVFGADDSLLGGLATPWAVDATGADVKTYFSLEGAKVTQHVITGDSTAYPVTTDPWLGIALISSVTRKYDSVNGGSRFYVYPTWWGRGGAGAAARWSAWSEARSKGVWDNSSLRNQFYCHYDTRPVTTFKSSWNLENWRSDKGYWGFMAALCN